MIALGSMPHEDLAQQIVYDLARPEFELAFVWHKEVLYYSYYPKGGYAPSSAVVALIQGLFEEFVDHSFFILRNRIYTTAVLRDMCLGMIKTVAKRALGNVPSMDHKLIVSFAKRRIGDDRILFHSTYLSSDNHHPLSWAERLKAQTFGEWVQRLARVNPRGEILHDFDRDIACFMLDQSGRFLGYGLNSNSKNKTLHAEVIMVQRYFRETGLKIPRGAQIITTRKPCRMCAGMILEWSEDPSTLKVHFLETDRSSQHTALDSVAQWFRLDSA